MRPDYPLHRTRRRLDAELFDATVAAGRYDLVSQARFALDTRLHPPAP